MYIFSDIESKARDCRCVSFCRSDPRYPRRRTSFPIICSFNSFDGFNSRNIRELCPGKVHYARPCTHMSRHIRINIDVLAIDLAFMGFGSNFVNVSLTEGSDSVLFFCNIIFSFNPQEKGLDEFSDRSINGKSDLASDGLLRLYVCEWEYIFPNFFFPLALFLFHLLALIYANM